MNKITIAIPNRNNEKYLSRCLKSVFKQSATQFDLIISDNGSTDSSIQIIRDQIKGKSVKFLQTDGSLSYSEHLLWILQQVETEYVIFLAGDDSLHREIVKTYLESLDRVGSRNKPGFICSPFYYIDSNNKINGMITWPQNRSGIVKDALSTFLRGPICNISSVAWDKELLKMKAPDFKKYGNCIDWFLYIACLMDKRDALCINQKLLMYRVHNQSTGNSNVKNHTQKCYEMFLDLQNDTRLKKEEYAIIAQNLRSFQNVINNKVLISNKSNRSLLKMAYNKVMSPYYFLLNYYVEKKCLF